MPKFRKFPRGRKPRSTRKMTTRRKILSALSGIVILAVVAFVLYSLLWGNSSETALPLNAVGSVFTTIQGAFARVTGTATEFVTTWRNYDDLKAENERLQRENTQLTLELNEAAEDITENERLLGLLDARETYDSLDPVFARVIARDAGQWFSTFTVNRGTAHGLKNGMSVVNQDGLIGHIYEIGTNYAKVITIIDSRSGLACLIQRTRDAGIMNGGVSGVTEDAECQIHYLPNINNIIPGDTVITSGTDSMYPKGLVIGAVSEINLNAGSEGGYAIVKPFVDFLHIEEVLVLRTAVETADDGANLPTLPTPTPGPTAAPTATPDPSALASVDPETGETNWYYPSQSTSSGDDLIQMLPEDDWVDD